MHRPVVKRAHDPVRFPGGRIRIGSVQYGVGAEIEDPTGVVWRTLELMDGTRSSSAIAEILTTDGVEPQDAADLVEQLCGSGHVIDADAPPVAGLNQRQRERYTRNENFFQWIDVTPRDHALYHQGTLDRSRVVVLGAGGSGSHVATSLVCAGVGHLTVVDFDNVALSNLNRQILFTEHDIGQPKVPAAVERLRAMNSDVVVEGVEARIESAETARRLIETADFVLLCADVPHPDVQLWTNDAAHAVGIPWSVCFYAGPTLMTGIFVPGSTPCYRCLLASGPSPLKAASGDRGEALYGATDINGVIAPTAGLAGQFGALEAIYFLTGLAPQTVGRLFHQNLMIYEHSYYVIPEAQSDCLQCGHLVGLGT